MTSVLECSSDLSCVQGELKVGCTISSFSFRVVLKPSKGSSYIYYFLTSFQSLTWKNVRKRLYYETLTFKSVNETFRYVRPDEIEAIEQHAVLSCCRVVVYFAVKKKNGLTFEFVCLKRDNSNESYWWWNRAVLLIMLYKVVIKFESVDETRKCYAVLSSY